MVHAGDWGSVRKCQTKEMLAEGLERMVEEMPLSKVRVKDLCERCGVQRQVFYYHFRDKYELLGWIFERDYRAGVSGFAGEGYIARATGAAAALWERRLFYRRAFADRSQGSIEHYIHAFNVSFLEECVVCSGGREISSRQSFLIRHHSHGSIGCIVEWLNGEIDLTPAQFAEWEYASMPEFLREALA